MVADPVMAAARAAMALSAGRASRSVQTAAEDNDRDTARAEGTWRRVVQALFALRHLQRIFKNVGDYLQEFPQTLRSALSLHIGGNRRAGGGRHSAGSVQQ